MVKTAMRLWDAPVLSVIGGAIGFFAETGVTSNIMNQWSFAATVFSAVLCIGATFIAMNRAIEQLSPKPELALIDGNRNKGICIESRCVVKGDSKCADIAAASILAKVTRDRYMLEMAEKYPQYRFEQHKGYGTKLHYEMLREYGPSPIHRRDFLRKMH